MTREEAIERIKTRFDKWALNDEDMKAIQTLIPELAESEDERITDTIFNCLYQCCDTGFISGTQRDDALAWLEKQKEQKPVSNPKWAELTWKDINELERIINNVHYEFQNGIGEDSFGELVLERFREYKDDDSMNEQKPEWSEEDEEKIVTISEIIEHCTTIPYSGGTLTLNKEYKKELLCFIKSLRPQSKDEIYKEKDEAFKLGKHQLAIKFMNYLDENRPEGKMSLSNGECEDIDKAFKENDWAKIMRYAEKYIPHWKPSEHQITILKAVKDYVGKGSGYWGEALGSLIEDLDKL